MQNVVNLQNNAGTTLPESAATASLPDEISWQAPEYRHVKKSSDWYWSVGILTAGLFAVSLIFNNILFGIFVLLGGFTIALYGARPPQTISFKLASSGIHIANRVYSYQSLKSFWIFYNPPDIKEISIESQKMIMPRIIIPLGDTNPAQVRAYLTQFLAERTQEESLIDSIVRYVGF
ncbi:MAG: hypothetical protein AAB710_01525 [Patescibacteria group bacterium]